MYTSPGKKDGELKTPLAERDSRARVINHDEDQASPFSADLVAAGRRSTRRRCISIMPADESLYMPNPCARYKGFGRNVAHLHINDLER